LTFDTDDDALIEFTEIGGTICQRTKILLQQIVTDQFQFPAAINLCIGQIVRVGERLQTAINMQRECVQVVDFLPGFQLAIEVDEID